MSYQTALLLKTKADQVRARSWDSMRQASCAFLRSLRNAILMSVYLVAGMPLCHANEPDGLPVDFGRDIKPILDKNCGRCHGPKKQESGLRLDDRRNLLQGGDHGKPAIVAGDSNESFLVELISGKNADLRMPPKGAMLSELQIQRIRDWIDQGASMPAQNSLPSETAESDLWSLRPLEPTSPPKMSDPWIKNPIDAFVLAKLRERGLKPASPTDARTMIRRVHLVVSGLPPTQEQIQHWNVGATPQDSLSDGQIAELS